MCSSVVYIAGSLFTSLAMMMHLSVLFILCKRCLGQLENTESGNDGNGKRKRKGLLACGAQVTPIITRCA